MRFGLLYRAKALFGSMAIGESMADGMCGFPESGGGHRMPGLTGAIRTTTITTTAGTCMRATGTTKTMGTIMRTTTAVRVTTTAGPPSGMTTKKENPAHYAGFLFCNFRMLHNDPAQILRKIRRR